MTYELFIDELKRLIPSGQAFIGNANAGTRQFRDWRLAVETLVRNTRKDGWDIPGIFGSEGRSYAPTWSPSSEQQKRATFDIQLGDSLAELRLIVEHFDKHGAPQRAGSQPAASKAAKAATAPPSVPESMTARWLLDLPVKIWFTFGGLLVAAFVIGFTVGQIPAARAVVCSVRPSLCPATSDARGAPLADLPYAVSVEITYDSATKRVNIVNKGQTNIYLWGTKLGEGPRVIEQEPRLVTPGGFYYLRADTLDSTLQAALRTRPEVQGRLAHTMRERADFGDRLSEYRDVEA